MGTIPYMTFLPRLGGGVRVFADGGVEGHDIAIAHDPSVATDGDISPETGEGSGN